MLATGCQVLTQAQQDLQAEATDYKPFGRGGSS